MAGPATVPARELSSINFRSMLGGPLLAVIQAQSQAAMSSVEFIKSVGFKPGDPNDPGGMDSAEPIYVSFKYPKEVEPYQPPVTAGVIGVAITDGGTGYTTAPKATWSGGGLSSSVQTDTQLSGGSVVSVALPEGAFTSKPTVEIAAPSASGGRQAEAEAEFREAQDAKPAVFQEMRLEVPILTMLPIPFIRIEETTIDFNAKINSIEEAATNSLFKLDSTLKYHYGAEVGVSVPIKLVSVLGKLSTSVDLKVSSSYQKNTSSGYKVDRTYSMNVHIRAVQDEMPAGIERLLGILEDNIKSQPVGAPKAAG